MKRLLDTPAKCYMVDLRKVFVVVFEVTLVLNGGRRSVIRMVREVVIPISHPLHIIDTSVM